MCKFGNFARANDLDQFHYEVTSHLIFYSCNLLFPTFNKSHKHTSLLKLLTVTYTNKAISFFKEHLGRKLYESAVLKLLTLLKVETKAIYWNVGNIKVTGTETSYKQIRFFAIELYTVIVSEDFTKWNTTWVQCDEWTKWSVADTFRSLRTG